MSSIVALSYLVSSVLFILSLYSLSSPKTSAIGNKFGIAAITLAILTTMFLPQIKHHFLIITAIAIGGVIGIMITKKVKMTAMPELIAGFHSLVGLSAVFIAASALLHPQAFNILINDKIKFASLIEISLGTVIGAITFSGSVVAFLKLSGKFNFDLSKIKNPNKLSRNLSIALALFLILFLIFGSVPFFVILTILSLIFGFVLIAFVGGADMPVVVSMLNSYSGWAASGIGFTLSNPLLIITGALVGSSGAILSYIMCKAMNRSIIKVIFNSFVETNQAADNSNQESKSIKQANAEDVAFMMKGASSVIIVPGYGMAVANAQHAVAEITTSLEKLGIEVKFAIHPVAGRMPGHMNVLLAEANIDYEKVFELEEINSEFRNTDIVLVVGANDVTNPAAKTDKTSAVYGMPILEVANARTIFFIKRSMNAGYAGVDNQLFYTDNTLMVFGDAKKVCEEITKNIN